MSDTLIVGIIAAVAPTLAVIVGWRMQHVATKTAATLLAATVKAEADRVAATVKAETDRVAATVEAAHIAQSHKVEEVHVLVNSQLTTALQTIIALKQEVERLTAELG